MLQMPVGMEDKVHGTQRSRLKIIKEGFRWDIGIDLMNLIIVERVKSWIFLDFQSHII